MVKLKTEEEIAFIKESSLILGKAQAEVAKILKPGITGLEVDKVVETFIRDNGGVPSFKNYRGFPFRICFSVNDAVVHGFATDAVLKEGDIDVYKRQAICLYWRYYCCNRKKCNACW